MQPRERLIGVRLSDVPLEVRRRRGRILLEHAVDAKDLVGSLHLHLAIESPSQRVYLVPESAVKAVLG